MTSKPLSNDVEVIRPMVRLSKNYLDFTGSSLLTMYVYIRKGESPIRKAIVKALVENTKGNKTCELILLDDGLGESELEKLSILAFDDVNVFYCQLLSLLLQPIPLSF